jgi:glycosyltransferase involved in cell wall biosynthesis
VERSDIAVVIPAFNEAGSIAAVVSGLVSRATVIVVDDASQDETAECARAAGAIVLRNERNLGYDGALDAGFDAASRAGCRFVVTMDADGQHSPQMLDAFARDLKAGATLVIGQRDEPARLSERLFSWYTRVRFGIRDPLCGMKGYDINLYRERGHFDARNSIGTELMLYGLRTCRRSTTTIRVPIAPRLTGQPRFAGVWRANYRIIRALALGIADDLVRLKSPI